MSRRPSRCAAAMSRAASVSCGLALAVTLSAPLARANGAFPSVRQLVIDPSDPNHLALRTTFGLLVSRDGGGQWDWLCEAGLGYQNIEPPIAILPGGQVLLGLPSGMSVGDPAGCNFELASSLTANITDVSVELGAPGGALATSVSFDPLLTRVWETTDSGRTWSELGEPIADFEGLTIDVVKNDPSRIYLSGLLANQANQGALLVSDDHGQGWQAHAIAGSDVAGQPYIAAISPLDPDTVYVRLAGFEGRLEVTHDAGASFTEVLSIEGPLQGFAISPDGRTVLVSSPYAGMYRADAATLVFEQLACAGTSCLSWTSAGLFGCGEENRNGFVLGRSLDQGASFEPALSFLCVRGPVACGSETSSAVCPGMWSDVAYQLGQTYDECDPQKPSIPFSTACLGQGGQEAAAGAGAESGSAGERGVLPAAGGAAGGDAGPTAIGGDASGGNAIGGEVSGGNATGGVSGSPPAPTPWRSRGGCDCSVPLPPSYGAPWLGLLALLGRRSVLARLRGVRGIPRR